MEALGPQYQGSKVGRRALEDEEEDGEDPFASYMDEDDTSGHSDEREASRKRSWQSIDQTADSEEEDSATDTSNTDFSSVESPDAPDNATGIEAQLKTLVTENSRRALASSLSDAKREDIEKGRSVKRQRGNFDSLLSTRMKLQKGLIATNTIVDLSPDRALEDARTAAEVIRSAEVAAFNLWQTITSLRGVLSPDDNGYEQQLAKISLQTSIEDLYSDLEAQEEVNKSGRNSILEKWSRKAQGARVLPERSRLNAEQQATIIDVLQEQLSNMERLVKKTYAPRSCAPMQASRRVVEDKKIYDDADFYGLLLKELLEQKSHDSIVASSIDIGSQMRRDNKTKRNVDTKASKGRKIRYTVQEKIQNFMAPEDRSSWGDRQTDELFGSLFGQRMELGDDHRSDLEGEVDPEEAGLIMFRS